MDTGERRMDTKNDTYERAKHGYWRERKWNARERKVNPRSDGNRIQDNEHTFRIHVTWIRDVD